MHNSFLCAYGYFYELEHVGMFDNLIDLIKSI